MTVFDNKWKNLPKVELHCHLDGSLSKDYLSKMMNRQVTEEEIQVQNNCGSLSEYLEKFDLPLRCLQTADQFREAGKDLIRTVVQENVKYLEVRFAPQLSTSQVLSVEKILESLLEGLAWGKKNFGVESNVIVCAMRHLSEQENIAMIRSAREFFGAGVCAVDLAGDEKMFPMAQFMNLFTQVKKLGMPFVIHAGECGSVQNILDAITCGARRIGHGISMFQDPEARQICLEKKIGIEMCPISNIQTKAIRNLAEYPLKSYLDQGLLVTVNTDNRTVSHTSLAHELSFVHNQYGITEGEIGVLMRNAVEVSFAEDEIKDRLLKMVS